MITNAPIVANQTQPVQTDFRMSRMRALRILGGAQIGLGVICVILGIVGVILSNTEKNKRCQSNNSGYDYMDYVYYYYYRCSDATGIVILYSICIACSGWFILTGCLPLCMTEKRQTSWKCLTVAFLVCNILSTVVFSSTVFILAIMGALIVSNKFHNEGVVTVFAILAIFAFIEFIISIVAASHCCCCSQLNIGNQQSVIYIHTVQPGMMHNMPNTRILTENQHEYDQLWNPGMAGYNGQQPANITINQQQPNHLQGNRMPIQDYHRQQSQPFTMPTQQQNINTQQLVYSPEAAGYTTIHEVNNTI
ncbi:uncharacterized protein LOC143078252 [Mytilus galloprovincialis]|uniref:uncharacterized protein LOC143078252 n=1 Tax=Mytilus galloprovincialis TaxID=29158 RepID=UPI003F7C731E